MKFLILLFALAPIALLANPGDDSAAAAYANRLGKPVRVFQHDGLKYSLDLQASSYTYIDLRKQAPEAMTVDESCGTPKPQAAVVSARTAL